MPASSLILPPSSLLSLTFYPSLFTFQSLAFSTKLSLSLSRTHFFVSREGLVVISWGLWYNEAHLLPHEGLFNREWELLWLPRGEHINLHSRSHAHNTYICVQVSVLQFRSMHLLSRAHWWKHIHSSDKHKIETICIEAHVHKQPLLHWHLHFFIQIGNNYPWYSYIIEFAHTSQLCSLPPPPVKFLDDPTTPAFRFFLCCQARTVGVCQKSFQQHPCFWMRALSPVRATSLNKTDKGS